jgi:hypothetical protein
MPKAPRLGITFVLRRGWKMNAIHGLRGKAEGRGPSRLRVNMGMLGRMHQRLTSFTPDFFAGEFIRNKKLNFNVIVFAGLKSDKKVS